MAQESLREGLRLEQLAELREKTEKVSKFFVERLQDHLETIRPLLAPARVFGKHVRSAMREDVAGADAAVRKLCENTMKSAADRFRYRPTWARTRSPI